MFLVIERKEYIGRTLEKILPNLNISEFNQLKEIYYELLEYIYVKLVESNVESDESIEDQSKLFYEQLKRNNDREIIAILNLLLPYINDKNDYENYKLIKNLKDITTLKNKDGEYIITNFQYSRGYTDNNNQYNEYLYNIEDIRINKELLKQTINRLRTKLYVNWVNVVPVNISEYALLQLFRSSVNYYRGDEKYKENAIPTGEIFDTLVNDLFLSTIEFKWLLYEKVVNENLITYIDILNEIYPVYKILNNKQQSKWLLIDDNLKNLFEKNMDLYFNKMISGEDYNNLPNDLLKDFFLSMLYFFDVNYKYTQDLVNNDDYNKISKSDVSVDSYDENEEDEVEMKEKKEKEIFENYKKIKKFYLYDFLRTQILKLNKTWYGFKIFNQNRIVKFHEYNRDKTDYSEMNFQDIKELLKGRHGKLIQDYDSYSNVIKLSYKNIYNFAKCFYYINQSNKITRIKDLEEYKNIVICPLYDSLNNEKKVLIENIIKNYFSITNDRTSLNDEQIKLIKKWRSEYFNISNNVRKKYGITDSSRITTINDQIIWLSFQIILNVTFECLSKRGLLSKFIIRREEFEKDKLNTKNLYQKNNQKIFKDHIDKYKDSHYYLTDDTYDNLPKVIRPKSKENPFSEKSYFDYLSDEGKWYNFYAMDWVSQINFYHHYINNRIVMLTGGTGVGKSSQVPKLLLYGLKAFDKNFSGKVICTQPRISPTTDNAKNISSEMGIPIEVYHPVYKMNVKSTYGIIQYKYEADNHIDQDEDYFLRIVTDGSLLVELKNSPILKTTYNESRNEFKLDVKKKFTHKNIYDIIIVDESHEHNANMDLILSIARGSIFLNNQLKLYIVSATMDADDPIYRKYFRLINDNLKYPIRDLYNNASATKFEPLLDRIVIDRRIHISPPGQTTQYKITEIYHDKEISEPESYKLAVKYAKEICDNNTPINNDILLFCTTSNKIIKLVDELNNVLPLNTIAIPFYSNLPEESKSLITGNLQQLKRTFKFDRKYIHDVLNLKKKPNEVPGSNKYDRILIVGTNIAEASITIDTLKFVIDTGFNLDVSYNYESGTSNIDVIPISESSRLQRKGRVGRVASGTVYYTYPEKSREKIIPSYSICKTNFRNSFIELLALNNTTLFDHDVFPFLNKEYSTLEAGYNINKSESENIEMLKFLSKYSRTENEKSFTNIIARQYATTSYLSSKQLFSPNLYNINMISETVFDVLTPFCIDGFPYETLIDKGMEFFIIHPFENIYGKYRNKNNYKLDNKHQHFQKEIENLIMDNIIYPLQRNFYLFKYEKQVNKIFTYYYLTLIKQKTDKLLDMSLFYPIIMGKKLKVLKNVLFIVTVLYELKNNLMDLVENIELFTKFFYNRESDLLMINKIFELFSAIYGHLLFAEDIDNEINKSYAKLIYNFNLFKKNNIKLLKIEEYNEVIENIISNDDEELIKEKLSKNKIGIKDIEDYNLKEIENWCKLYGINFKSFIKIIDSYKINYKNYEYILSEKKNGKKNEYLEYLNNLTIINELSVEKNIVKCFLYGNIDNIFIFNNNQIKNSTNINSIVFYKKNNFKKRWISKVITNYNVLALSKENEPKDPQKLSINDDDETNNNVVALSILSNIDNKMLFDVNYYHDNPSNKQFMSIDNINHNYICNNPINIEHNKNPNKFPKSNEYLDPKFNEYINILQNQIKDYIDKHC